MVEPWAVEFEKSECVDHTYREVPFLNTTVCLEVSTF
jgi:hypothetical protein